MQVRHFMAAAIGIAGFTTLTATTAQAQLKVAVIENLSGPGSATNRLYAVGNEERHRAGERGRRLERPADRIP